MKHIRWIVLSGLVAALVGALAAAERSSATMAAAATRFLAGLTPEQRQQASFPFTADERLHWHFIPTEMFARNGLTIKAMTEPQRKLARDLLRAGLSQRGYLTATSIMDLETVLGEIERAARQQNPPRQGATPLVRDPEKYFFSIFGTPSAKDTWGWRVEGHHVSLNFTVVNGTLVAGSPSFFGSNPAEVRDGPKKGLRILGAEEDAARALLDALDAPQREKATLAKVAPNDMVTMNKNDIDPLAPAGITADGLNAKQRDLLMKLIDVYAGAMAGDIAADRMSRLRKAGLRRSRSPGRARSKKARSITTGSRDRPSSSSTTTRRTTGTTFTPCGAISTATSGATCSAST